MQKFSKGYVFGFAAAVCLFCSILVAGAAVSLKPKQDENKVLDKQKKVLVVAGLMREGEELSKEEVAERFDANIVPRLVNLETGEYVEDDVTKAATFDMEKAAKEKDTGKAAPDNKAKVLRIPNEGLVYELRAGGTTAFQAAVQGGEEPAPISGIIIPIKGKGLWSTMLGFLTLEADATTISGIIFYSHGETPGLGGEVENPRWRSLWKGRKAGEVVDGEWETKIRVIKGSAGPPSEAPYSVDGLSGATLTSNGVTNSLEFWLGEHGFQPYLAQFRGQSKGASDSKGKEG